MRTALGTWCQTEFGTLSLALALLAACGTPARLGVERSAESQREARATSPSPLAWQWNRFSAEEGHLRVESETYQLEIGDSGALSGWMIRENRFLSTDGQPFACMQGLSYTQRARYRLQGTLAEGDIELAEVEVTTLPSPCEAGLRPLQTYRGRRHADGGLELTWAGGEQRLTPRAPVAASEQALLWPTAPSLTGSWVWGTREREGSVERLEREQWTIEELPRGRIQARYDREVAVVDRSGASIACAGADRYSYQDSYELRGLRDGKGIHMLELSVRTAEHPCVARERVLDTAKARLYADALQLEWRGKRVQVLRRARDRGRNAVATPAAPRLPAGTGT